MPEAFLKRLGEEFGFEAPMAHGLDTVGAIEAMRDGFAAAGQQVTLTNTHGGVTRRVEGWTVIPYDIPREQLAAYFPEANELVPLGQRAPNSRTPASKSVAVRIARVGP